MIYTMPVISVVFLIASLNLDQLIFLLITAMQSAPKAPIAPPSSE